MEPATYLLFGTLNGEQLLVVVVVAVATCGYPNQTSRSALLHRHHLSTLASGGSILAGTQLHSIRSCCKDGSPVPLERAVDMSCLG